MPDATALSNGLRNERVVQRPVLTVHAGLKGDPRQNRLLAALPAADLARWLPHLEPVTLSAGQVLCESGARLSHVYLPTTAVVSMRHLTTSGASAAIALVGNDGLVGISLFMGGNSTTGQAVVLCAGQGFRLPAPLMMLEFNRGGDVMHLLLRYTQALIAQMSQTAVCNRFHALDRQLCRCLLLCFDRVPGTKLAITQEVIANTLGVRREGVTDAAGRLQADGLIHYHRGHIEVLDRTGLQARSCECYAVVRQEYERLLPAARVG